MKHWCGAGIAETIFSRLESREGLLLGYLVVDVRVWSTASGVGVINTFGNTKTKSLEVVCDFLLVRLSGLHDKRLGYY